MLLFVTDAIFAVPEFGQQGFCFRIRVLYPVLTDSCTTAVLSDIKSSRAALLLVKGKTGGSKMQNMLP